jgi:transposase-like protein
MGRRAIRSADEKLNVVMTVLKGEMTQVEIARRLDLAEPSPNYGEN